MFDDKRSKSVVFVAHCILNQNTISDGTAVFPAGIKEIVELLLSSEVGIGQMPCPELHCLGLDRGDFAGSSRPVVEENTRIRHELIKPFSRQTIQQLARQTVFQISQYVKFGFDVKGVIGVNRSPSCGVDATSEGCEEVAGEGVFIAELRQELEKKSIDIPFVGIKATQIERAIAKLKSLLGEQPQAEHGRLSI